MSLDVGEALRDGADRTTERTGLLLIAAFATLGLASLLIRQTFLVGYFEWVQTLGADTTGFEQPPLPVALPLPMSVALVLWILSAVVAEAVRIVAVRTMVGDHTDRIPRSLATRNIALATVNGFVGGIVVGVVVGLGTLLFVIPGVFLAVSFLFVRQEIAVQDVNFVDAMANSWELTSGNRVEVLLLGIAWVALSLVVVGVNAGLGVVLPADSPVSPILSVLLGAPVTVFVVASAARAYVQLTADDEAAAEEAGATDEGDEWDDPPGVDV